MTASRATAWLTAARFAPYLSEADCEHEHAVALYVWNARVSAAVFETLHHVEVLLRNTFPHGSGERAEVAGLMSRLVPFRNRLAHHETIIRRPISSHYDEMLQLAGLIDPDARAWIESVTRVPEILNERPQRG